MRIAGPERMQMDTIRLYAISKIPWIRRQQEAIKGQERETNREYLNRESHYVWGQRYLLKIMARDDIPAVKLRRNQLQIHVRPRTSESRLEEILAEWYRDQVRMAVDKLVNKWSPILGVKVKGIFVQRMKTKWGSCNPTARTIRLNTELAKKPPECLEYVTVHEMVHLLEPTHNGRFIAFMDQHLPGWAHKREQLNRVPLRNEEWAY